VIGTLAIDGRAVNIWYSEEGTWWVTNFILFDVALNCLCTLKG